MPIIDSRTSIPAGTNRDNPVIAYDQVMQNSSVSASSAQTADPASNLKNSSTAEFWQAGISGFSNITITAPAGSEVNAIQIGPHNLAGGTVTISRRIPGADFITDLEPAKLITDNTPIIYLFDPQIAQDWLIRVEPEFGFMRPKVASIFMGKSIVLPSRIYVGHTPINYGRNTSVLTGMSESGEFLGRVITGEVLSSEFSMKNVSPSDYRSMIDPFSRAAISKPFAFAWRPESYPNETAYCWANSNIVPSNSSPNGMMEFKVNYKAHSPWS